MKNNWRDFVQFSNSERKGIIALSIMALVFAAYNYYVPQWISNKQIKNFEAKYAAALQKSRAASNEVEIETNPVAEIAKNNLKDTVKVEVITNTNKPVPPKEVYKLNTVSANQLIKTGIDPKFAFRIVKFREGLGGFHSSNQIKEVFEVTDEVYKKVVSSIDVTNLSTSKIHINSASSERLRQHSYISPKLAQQIISFREKVKPFQTPDDVLKLYFVDEELHKKLIPYISFN